MYSRKRVRGDGSLTGGTGDVNPQWMSSSLTQATADTAATGSIQPPVSLSTGENLAMEILKVMLEEVLPVQGVTSNVAFTLATKNFGTTQPALGIGDATVIARYARYTSFTTSGEATVNPIVMYDYTDGDGHGVLVGNQNLYWTLTSTGTSQANRVNLKILYRAKRISDSELLGIVLQSNQN